MLQFGIDEQISCKIQNINDLASWFHRSVGCLPRRPARNNRRGKSLIKQHREEDRIAAAKLKKLGASCLLPSSYSPVQCRTPTDHSKASHSLQTSSTSEMDRLEARSKAALKNKQQALPKTNSEFKRLRLSTVPSIAVAKTPPSNPIPALSPIISATIKPPVLNKSKEGSNSSSLTNGNSSKLDKDKFFKVESEKSVTSKCDGLKPRKKLKRDSFLTANSLPCKAQKTE